MQEVTRRFGTVASKKSSYDPATRAAEKSKLIGEALVAIPDAHQAKRFRDLMIQRRVRAEFPLASTSLDSGFSYPGVADELKLTAEQKKRLIDGDHSVEVLTDVQRKAFKEMLGERFTSSFRSGPAAIAPARTDPALQKERDRAEFLKTALRGMGQ